MLRRSGEGPGSGWALERSLLCWGKEVLVAFYVLTQSDQMFWGMRWQALGGHGASLRTGRVGRAAVTEPRLVLP